MLVAARFGRGDRDQLHLGELVLADHAARVLAGGARLGAEARRAGGEAQRQLGLVEDRFAHQIGERHLGGGDEPEAVRLEARLSALASNASCRPAHAGRTRRCRSRYSSAWRVEILARSRSVHELVVFEFRQLRGAEHHLVAHQQRRRHLRVAMLARVQVEHELPERALQPRKPLLQHHEARAGELRRGLEIHLPERFAELEMLLRRETHSRASPRTCDARHCRARRRRPARRRAAGWGFAPARRRAPAEACLLLGLQRRDRRP